MGATGLAAPAPPPAPARPSRDRLSLAVVGAHLSGLPLNRELVDLGAIFLREVETSADYRLFALPGTSPAKPGLLRVGEGEGGSIRAEIWALDPAAFGNFVSRIPSPLGVGTLKLADGGSAQGFLVEAEAVKGAKDITSFGGWRAYLASEP
jgi:allophanate hydrolase